MEATPAPPPCKSSPLKTWSPTELSSLSHGGSQRQQCRRRRSREQQYLHSRSIRQIIHCQIGDSQESNEIDVERRDYLASLLLVLQQGSLESRIASAENLGGERLENR